MSDVDSGASAPADAGGVAIEANNPPTQPLGSQAPVKEKPDAPVAPEKPVKPEADDKPSKTAREAVEKAFQKVNDAAPDKASKDDKAAAKPAESKTEPKADARPEQPRDNGRFASANPKPEGDGGQQLAKPQGQVSDAPARFSEDAKRDWQTAPESVRRESERAIRELTQGIEKHKPAAEAYEKIKQFDDLAKSSGTDLHTALSRYVNMEATLRQNPLKGLEAICDNIGVSLREVAAHVLGQTPDQTQSQSDATIRELRQQISTLQQQVGGVQQTFAQQKQDATLKDIQAFAAKPENARFEELADDIAYFMAPTRDMQGNIIPPRAKDLSEAYRLAERLNPASAPQTAQAVTSAPAQTQRGTKSISGAPAAGSDPEFRKPASSNRQALERAAQQLGLR